MGRYLKKRYLLEKNKIKTCPVCNEFNLNDHLPSFDFHHHSEKKFHINPFLHSDIVDASQLFIQSYSCSEISKILEFEIGGFLCRNCHNVLEYNPVYLDNLEDIYQDTKSVQTILEDYNSTKLKFKFFQNSPLIKNPLKINTQITESYEKYLNCIKDLTLEGKDITIRNLAQNLKLTTSTVRGFLKAKKEFFDNFLTIDIGKNRLKNYILTKRGIIFIELIQYIKEYYKKFFNKE